ncbi:MAG: hypothetical protein KDB27_25020 [Planctomycetales bacterium]|nr:hypothetical protein [Planctomycetales bacterium]
MKPANRRTKAAMTWLVASVALVHASVLFAQDADSPSNKPGAAYFAQRYDHPAPSHGGPVASVANSTIPQSSSSRQFTSSIRRLPPVASSDHSKTSLDAAHQASRQHGEVLDSAPPNRLTFANASDDEEDEDNNHDDTGKGGSNESEETRAKDDSCNDVNPYVCVKHGEVPYDPRAFGDDPDYSAFDYNPNVEKDIYYGKYLNPTQRPWIELGRGLYRAGEIPRSETWMGKTNLVAQHFLLYGDYRTAVAFNQNGANEQTVWAHRLNLDLDWKITSTERVHAFIGPLDRGPRFTRLVYDNGEIDYRDEFDYNFDTIFFEGDIGAIHAGWNGVDPELAVPFAAGLIPVFYQNGYWIEDAFVGAMVTMLAKQNPKLDWANYDVTGFVGFDKINSPAFGTDDSAARVYGVHTAIDAYGGYLETGYAFLDDQTNSGLSYHNLGVSFTRRYFERISNSIRFFTNTEQNPIASGKTASGQLIVIENSLVSHNPTFFVPYCNLFLGKGSPQSVARAAVAGGILRNIGINFETDGLTGYPLMDDTANNTYGGAIGVNILGPELNYQIVLELAAVQTFGTAVNRRSPGDQYGFGARYQLPLNHAWIWRMDGMYAIQENAEDLAGVRTELRYKF